MNDSHGFPWYTIPMVTITVGRWFTSLVVAMPKGPWISRRKRTKGRKWRREVTRSFGTENNQEINMQGGPFQRSLNGVTGGALLNFLAENKWPNWSFSLAFLGNWWPFWDGELRSRDPFRSKVGMVTETKKSGMKFGHDLNHLEVVVSKKRVCWFFLPRKLGKWKSQCDEFFFFLAGAESFT